jgi:hypothetical protein
MRRLVLTPCAKQKDPKTGAEVLLLVNIGSHDEVY